MQFLPMFIVLILITSGCGASVPANALVTADTPLAVLSITPQPITPRPSSTSPLPTATFTPLRTPTASPTLPAAPPVNATALRLQIGAEYSTYYWLQVVSFPQRYIGEKVIMEGFVLEVIDATTFRIRLPDNSPAFVVASTPLSDLNIGDKVAVYATMQGRVCAQNGPLETFCQIVLSDAYVGR